MMQHLKVIISGGGTGGHIYPAIAIANEIKQRYPHADILFVGASDRMEMEKVPQAGYPIKGLWISGLQRKLTLKNLLFPIKLLVSLIKSQAIINKFKPHLVVGTGGFASGPLLYVASRKGIPSVIQEQNSYPGITNKILGRYVNKICVAYDGLERFFPKSKLLLTGNPVRSVLTENDIDQLTALKSYALNSQKSTLLVLGGSLGSQRINALIASRLERMVSQDVQIIWQCGALYYERYKHLAKSGIVEIKAYINDMATAFSAADIIVSRAGASSVSELCLVGKPVLFIPSPNVAENHQYKNAKALADKNAACVLEESQLETNFDNVLDALFKDKDQQQQLIKNIKQLAKPNATSAIVNALETIIKPHAA